MTLLYKVKIKLYEKLEKYFKNKKNELHLRYKKKKYNKQAIKDFRKVIKK